MNKDIHIHADINSLECDAKNQFEECCSHDFVLEAALMPDAHSGYVAPIGSVIKTKGAIVPAWVGYDIGCGMIAIKVSHDKEIQDFIKHNAQELFDLVNDFIPMGAGRHNDNSSVVFLEYTLLDKINNLKLSVVDNFYFEEDNVLFEEVKKLSRPNIGTLGSGNHFIEILEYENELWLVIHSGSRGVGHYVGTHFMKKASGMDKSFEETYAITNESLKQEYMIYQNYCLEFALLNRLSMAHKVASCIEDLVGRIKIDIDSGMWTNKNHNHCIEIAPDVYLHRKGATSSELGERGIIPANMKDGCFLVEGLGNIDFLNSSSHGAGRSLSRGEAKRKITLEQFQETMNGIVAPVNKHTIDESPMAYKNIFDVMKLQKDSVKVLKHLKPIINWKGF